MTKTTKPFQLIVAGAAAIAALAVGLGAQQTSLTVGIAARLAAGPDYATDVLADPWDMCNREDVSPEPDEWIGWSADSGFATSGPCKVGGTTTAIPSQLSFLYRGFEDVINPGRSGVRFPIDPNVYKKIAFKMFSGPTTNYQFPRVYWFHRPFNLVDPAFGVRFVGFTDAGNTPNTKIYVGDLTQSLSAGEAWTANLVRGLRIDPNTTQSGQQVFFSWVRLTRGDTDPAAIRTPITWSAAGSSSTIDVIDAGGTVLNVATVSGSAGTYDWKYGALPPGSYTLKITSGSTITTQAFKINTPPSFKITDPDETGGDDFATTVLNNPWDMSDAADVQNTLHLNPALTSFHDGLFDATSDGWVSADGLSGDAEVWFLSSNVTRIDSQKYRFLTFRMQLDSPFNLYAGSVARVFWGSSPTAAITTSQAIIAWPFMASYTIDLGSLTANGGGIEPGGSTITWGAAPVRHFEIDPHEFGSPGHRFEFDDVKIAAMDEAKNGHFVITFAGSDPDTGEVPTASLYYNATPTAAGRKLIASNVPVSAGQYDWNTASVTPGTYYISADVTDGLDTRTYYSSGALLVSSATALATGDDLAVDFGAAGLSVRYNGGPSFTALHPTNPGVMATGDIDGNGKKDLIVDFPGQGVWAWLNNSSWRQLHASDPKSIVIGDLDGNGLSEVLMDFPGWGIWIWNNDTYWSQLHTSSPSRMATGDLDGNGKDEVIVDFQGWGIWIWSNGTGWRVLSAQSGTSLAVGDVDGNGKADVLVGFTSIGLWVFYNNATWGLLHSTAPSRMVTGDLDGNGRREAIVDFPGSGLWVWRNNSAWSLLHSSDAEDVITADLDGNGRSDVIIDFGGSGLWAWMNDGAWVQLSTTNPQGLAAGNLDGQ